MSFEDQTMDAAGACPACDAGQTRTRAGDVGPLTAPRTRRAMLGAAALGVLGLATACGGESAGSDNDQPVTIARVDVPAVNGEPVEGSDGVFYLVRNEAGVMALSRTCTHMGCKVPWKQSEGCFHCPCHNSKFDRNGVEFAGPAKRPLALCAITVQANGDIVVNPDKQTDRKAYDPSQVTPWPVGNA